jgi:hypothetical protein
MDAKLESAILELNTSFTAKLESIADLVTNGGIPSVRPMGIDTGNTPQQSSVDVLSRWHWLDKSTIESIAGGTFDIYSLPKLHREEHLRFRHTTKSTEGLFMPINGTHFEHVTGRTRMQSSFPQITTFLSAWQVYKAVRITFSIERAASIDHWTERLIVRANVHPWSSVLNYAVAYFQKYQNASPDAWFSSDLELIADHLVTSYQTAANAPGPPYKASPKKSDNPYQSNVCQNWMHASSCMLHLPQRGPQNLSMPPNRNFRFIKLTHWEQLYDHVTNTNDYSHTFDA